MPRTIRTLVVFLWTSFASLAFAQAGGLRGVVADTSGAPVPGAQVTVSNDRGINKVAVTSDTGAYVMNGLPPGKYNVKGSFPGMQSQPGTAEVSDGIATLDITL